MLDKTDFPFPYGFKGNTPCYGEITGDNLQLYSCWLFYGRKPEADGIVSEVQCGVFNLFPICKQLCICLIAEIEYPCLYKL